MIMRSGRLLAIFSLMLLMSSIAIFAQDDDNQGEGGTIIDVLNSLTIDDNDSTSRYNGIPQERTEDGAFILGNPDAEIVIVEFADFMCPHCQVYEETIEQFIEVYVATGDVRLEYRMFPVVHPSLSPLTAQIAECAGEAGKFWDARALIFEITSTGGVDASIIDTVAEAMDMNADDLATCAQEADQYAIDSALAQEAGVTGTPAVLLRVGDSGARWIVANNEPLRGALPFEVLELIVDAAQNDQFEAN